MDYRWVLLVAAAFLIYMGCGGGGVIEDDDDDSVSDDDDSGVGDDDDDTSDPCTGFEFTMLEPTDGDTQVDPEAPVVFRWNQQPNGPFARLLDGNGDDVELIDQEINGDVVATWFDMRYDRTYTFRAGFFCDTEGSEHQVELATASFSTGHLGDDDVADDDDCSDPGDPGDDPDTEDDH